MSRVAIDRAEFLKERQGRTFADVAKDEDQPFGEILAFFSNEARQRRMEESEIHHDRPALAGVVRELESIPTLDRFFGRVHPPRTKRLRQAVGVLVRMIMERRGWRKTGKKGSLGVRAAAADETHRHNSGGLAFWFIRAERYEPTSGIPYHSVRDKRDKMLAALSQNAMNRPANLQCSQLAADDQATFLVPRPMGEAR